MRAPMHRGLVRLFRGGVLAVLAVSSLVVWVHLTKNLPAHEREPGLFLEGQEATADVASDPHTAQTRYIKAPAVAIVATSCELRCGSDAHVEIPAEGAISRQIIKQCACDSGSCPHGAHSHDDPCCANYLLHCTDKSSHTASAFKPAALQRHPPAPNPRPFPPLHYGPELVYLDVVVVFCESPHMRAAKVGIRCVAQCGRSCDGTCTCTFAHCSSVQQLSDVRSQMDCDYICLHLQII